MRDPEAAFDAALRAACGRVREQTGITHARLLKQADAHGAVAAVREQLRRRQVSDGFDRLARCGGLRDSVEALVTEGQFGSLFSDEEVNFCFSLLCEAGYYGGGLR